MQYKPQCLWNRTTNQRWRWWRWWWWYHDILLHFRTHVVFGSFSSCIFAIASRSRSRSTRHTNHPPSPNTTKKKKKTRSSFEMFLLSSHNNTPDKNVVVFRVMAIHNSHQQHDEKSGRGKLFGMSRVYVAYIADGHVPRAFLVPSFCPGGGVLHNGNGMIPSCCYETQLIWRGGYWLHDPCMDHKAALQEDVEGVITLCYWTG